MKDKKEKPKVEINAEAEANVIYGDNNTIIIAHPKILEIAEKSFSSYQRLSKAIDGNNIKQIAISELSNGAKHELINMDENTKELCQ